MFYTHKTLPYPVNSWKFIYDILEDNDWCLRYTNIFLNENCFPYHIISFFFQLKCQFITRTKQR